MKRSQEGKLDESFIDGILASEKPNQKEKLSFKSYQDRNFSVSHPQTLRYTDLGV